MSPEQKRVLAALNRGEGVTDVIDGRSDIYSLGLVLYEAAGGTAVAEVLPPLRRIGAPVTRGFSDIIAKCLAARVEERYQDAGALAADLWAHLHDQPLQGVANRSLRERWRKWRRRRPHQLAVLVLLGALVTSLGLAALLFMVHCNQRLHDADHALAEGQRLLRAGRHGDAVSELKRGLLQLAQMPGSGDRREQLAKELQHARCEQLSQELHELADRFRFLYGNDALPATQMKALHAACATFWQQRALVQTCLGKERNAQDLLDLTILGADLGVRLAGPEQKEAAQRKALQLLAEAEAIFGPSAVLYHERQKYAQALGLTERAEEACRRAAACPPRTAWEHYALGRALMQADQLAEAAVHLDRAAALQPEGLWPNFYQGICCYRQGRFDDAVLAFTACTTLAPHGAAGFYNRGVALSALGRHERARQDFERALQLDPSYPRR
jgi:tetratricopeptide (TPR) repeat protein